MTNLDLKPKSTKAKKATLMLLKSHQYDFGLLILYYKGMKEIDYNEEDEGFGFLQRTVANGVRQSAANVFLYPFAGR